VALDGGDTTRNRVQGNSIGTDKDGLRALANAKVGVRILDGAHGNAIGGTVAGAGNAIAFNGESGVVVGEGTADLATGNTVYSNAIFSNRKLGIDLGNNGVTANDRGDADDGPNHLQNYPVLAAFAGPHGTRVAGQLSSTPHTQFALDFYLNAPADASGYGEGQVYLGRTGVTTDAQGNASFHFSPAQSIANRFVTATATNVATGDTSEFSRAVGAVRDVTAPTVTQQIEPYDFFSPRRVLFGTARDEGAPQSGIERVLVRLQRPFSSTTITREATIVARLADGSVRWRLALDNTNLAPSGYVARAVAEDNAGNQSAPSSPLLVFIPSVRAR